MPTVQQWGRRESIIWPRGYLYTLGAFFLACVATGFFIYLRFQFGLQPLQTLLPAYYLRSETAALRIHQQIRDAVCLGRRNTGRAALEAMCSRALRAVWRKGVALDTKPGNRSPWHLTSHARGTTNYQNKVIHAWMRTGYTGCFALQPFQDAASVGLAAFVLQLPFSIHKDIGRIKQLRYGRRLKGPVLVNAKEFTAAVSGNGIGIKTMISSCITHPARCGEQAFPYRGRHRFRQVEHHPPNALPGRCSGRQCHRL